MSVPSTAARLHRHGPCVAPESGGGGSNHMEVNRRPMTHHSDEPGYPDPRLRETGATMSTEHLAAESADASARLGSARRREDARTTGLATEAVRPTDARAEDEQTLELREEQLIAHKELREVGEVTVRTEIEQLPGRLEVDAYREEVSVEHEPVGQVVSERQEPWEEDGTLVVPVYEEQLVVTKRLVLRERLRVRRVGTTERQLFEDTLRRERLVVEDPQHTGLVHERYPTGELAGEAPSGATPRTRDDEDDEPDAQTQEDRQERSEGGFFEHLVRKALE